MDYFSTSNNIEEWNENIEKILQEQKYKCFLYKILHEKESNRLNFLSKSLNCTNIVIVTFIATGTAVTNDKAYNNTEWAPVVNIGYSVLLFTSAILTSVGQYYNFEKKSEKNRLASLKFETIYNNIKRMLSLDKKYRHHPSNYFNMINREYDNVFLNSPDIEEITLKNYTDNIIDNEVCDNKGHCINIHSHEERIKMNHEIEGFVIHSHDKTNNSSYEILENSKKHQEEMQNQ